MVSPRADGLFLSERKLLKFAKTVAEPFYLYDEKGICEAAAGLLSAFSRFPGFRQYFPVSLNANAAILQLLRTCGCGVRCENPKQVTLARSCGFCDEEILYSPLVPMPVDGGERLTWVIDCPEALPPSPPKRALLCVRPSKTICPDGIPIRAVDTNKTGMSEQELFRLAVHLKRYGTERIGLIVNASVNDPRPQFYPAVAEYLFRLAVRLQEETGIAAECCNLSDGLGTARQPDETAPDPRVCAERIEDAAKRILVPAGLTQMRLELAAGRCLLAPYGIFVTAVAGQKERKRPVIITQAAACQLPDASLLGTYHHISVPGKSAVRERMLCDVAGCQYDLTRLMAEKRLLPPVARGDFLVFHTAGVQTVLQNLPIFGYEPCASFLLKTDGTITAL